MTAQPTATPSCQTIELQLTGYPNEPYRWGDGHVRPDRVSITTLDNSRSAHLYGTWINENGEPTRDPVDVLYRNDDEWPDWLSALADEHRPDVVIARPDAIRDDEADLPVDSIDRLRAQLATAETQVAAWNSRIRELTSQIRQHDQGQPTQITGPQPKEK